MTVTPTETTNETKDRSSTIEMKLEVVVVPVSDVDRARDFYEAMGWRMDIDHTTPKMLRVVQLTPPGSGTSIIIGEGITDAAPGSMRELQLVVSDIEAARAELIGRGIAVSELFHDRDGIFHHAGTAERVQGGDPERRSYGSFVSFEDPDGNGWILQEVTARAPGRVEGAETTYSSEEDLAAAMRRAAARHGQHEREIGHADPVWPDWYAAYMVREQGGADQST